MRDMELKGKAISTDAVEGDVTKVMMEDRSMGRKPEDMGIAVAVNVMSTVDITRDHSEILKGALPESNSDEKNIKHLKNLAYKYYDENNHEKVLEIFSHCAKSMLESSCEEKEDWAALIRLMLFYNQSTYKIAIENQAALRMKDVELEAATLHKPKMKTNEPERKR